MFVDGIENFARIFPIFHEIFWKLRNNIAANTYQSVSNVGKVQSWEQFYSGVVLKIRIRLSKA